MTIKVDDKLKDYKWLTTDCINIIKEIKQKEPLDINFTLQDAGFGNQRGKLVMKEKDKIVVIKDYPYMNLDVKEVHMIYKDENLLLK